ncbi:MAG: hypothetical protein IIA67_13210 [Planctomycetes bacterium]|nr:hypothetical protein [Planctomycetota bacterium]
MNERLKHLGHQFGAHIVEPPGEWYGFDPIHVKMRHWARAWGEIMGNWAFAEKKISPAAGSLRRWFYLRRLRPQHRRWLGIDQRRDQPSGRLRDGTSIALY